MCIIVLAKLYQELRDMQVQVGWTTRIAEATIGASIISVVGVLVALLHIDMTLANVWRGCGIVMAGFLGQPLGYAIYNARPAPGMEFGIAALGMSSLPAMMVFYVVCITLHAVWRSVWFLCVETRRRPAEVETRRHRSGRYPVLHTEPPPGIRFVVHPDGHMTFAVTSPESQADAAGNTLDDVMAARRGDAHV